MGEAKRKVLVVQSESIALDTFGGRIHVEWDPSGHAARAVAVLYWVLHQFHYDFSFNLGEFSFPRLSA